MVLGGADKPSRPHRKGGSRMLLLDPAFPRNLGPSMSPRVPVRAGHTPEAGASPPAPGPGEGQGPSSRDPGAIQALLPGVLGESGRPGVCRPQMHEALEAPVCAECMPGGRVFNCPSAGFAEFLVRFGGTAPRGSVRGRTEPPEAAVPPVQSRHRGRPDSCRSRS